MQQRRLVFVLAFAVLVPSHLLGQVNASGCPAGSVVPPPTGMVAWWPLGESTGSTVSDASGNSHDGSTRAGPIGAPGSPKSVPGFVTGALYFSQNSYVRVQPGVNFGTGDFSIDAWIKTTAFPPIVNNMGLFGGYRLYINASHQLVLQLGLTTIGAVTVIGPSISSGQWNFVGVVVNRSTSKVSFYSKVAGSSGPLVPVMVFQNFAGVSATSSQPLDIGRAAGPPLAGIGKTFRIKTIVARSFGSEREGADRAFAIATLSLCT